MCSTFQDPSPSVVSLSPDACPSLSPQLSISLPSSTPSLPAGSPALSAVLSARTAVGATWLLALVVTGIYTGNLVASLSTKKSETRRKVPTGDVGANVSDTDVKF